MEIHDIITWIIILILIIWFVQMTRLEYFAETSVMRNRMQDRNEVLAMKCGRMFNGYPEYMNMCATEDGIHLKYAVGISNAYDIWEQNFRDGVHWRPEIYLALVLEKTPQIICEVVYPPDYRSGCQRMSEGMRREAWQQYWEVRQSESNNWQLSDAHTRLR